MIELGEWTPDQPAFGNSVESLVNAVPGIRGYKSQPDKAVLTSALTGTCKGFFAAKDSDGVSYNIAADATDLYQLPSGSTTWASRKGSFTTATDDAVEFIQWGDTVISTNYAEYPQTTTLTTTLSFSDLQTVFKAKHVAAIKNFVVFGNIDDGAAKGNQVRWSAFEDATDYTVSSATQSDFQDILGDGGNVQAITSGEYGLVFQEKAIQRMTYIGTPLIFQFDEIESERGTPAPNSVVQVGRMVFFLADDGFYVCDGTQSYPIGANKVDQTFYTDVDQTLLSLVWGAADPINTLVYWVYPGTANNGQPNKGIVYNWTTKKWGSFEMETELVARSYTQGYTIDSLDSVSSSIDALPASLDSRIWAGGANLLVVFDQDHKMNSFTGADLTATIETGEQQLSPGHKTQLSSVRPYVDGGTTSIRVGHRDTQNGTVAYTTSSTENTNGECRVRNHARFQRFELSIAGGFTDAYGIEITEARRMGKR